MATHFGCSRASPTTGRCTRTGSGRHRRSDPAAHCSGTGSLRVPGSRTKQCSSHSQTTGAPRPRGWPAHACRCSPPRSSVSVGEGCTRLTIAQSVQSCQGRLTFPMRPSAGAAASASSARGAKAGSGSGAAAAKSSGAARKSGAAGRTRDLPQLSDFVDKCDWTGALALLDFNRRSGEGGADTLAWIAYSAFHLGDFARALDTFEQLEVRCEILPWMLA